MSRGHSGAPKRFRWDASHYLGCQRRPTKGPRSSRGGRGFVCLAELSPQLLQPVQKSLPSRFNRVVTHDVSPFTHTVPVKRRSGATLGQCAPFSQKPPDLRMSADALTPIFRKARETFAGGVEWQRLRAPRLVRPRAAPPRLAFREQNLPAQKAAANGRATLPMFVRTAYPPQVNHNAFEPVESQFASVIGG